MVCVVYVVCGMLVVMVVEEMGCGNYCDKVVKNDFVVKNVYNYIKDDKMVGIINDDLVSGVMKVVELVGIIVGVILVINLILIVIFNVMLVLKICNFIIFGFYFFV